MERYNVTISEENRVLEFNIDPEDAFLELYVASAAHSSDNSKRLIASLAVTIIKTNERPIKHTLDFNNQDTRYNSELKSVIPTTLDSNYEKITLELLPENTMKGFQMNLEVIQGFSPIKMSSPLDEFNSFFNNRINSKLLFSAPFGSGKSTFLNYYFNEEKYEDFNVFTVYPVNYSIASNNDIFTYIKADLLMQLLANDLEFDNNAISFLEATEEFVYLKPEKAILSFLETVSSLNPKIDKLSKSLSNLNKLVKEIRIYQAERKVDDKEKAIDFIKEIYDKEGSLFEDNFFTQLIRQLLEQLKNKNNKQTVLIIEDLDRMDPDHIFRILNIISAHYDTFKFSDGQITLNKFGFDKVIIVGDIDNIQNIFHHKYGAKTDFRGYINKFFSSRPFNYDNKKQISSFINERFGSKPTSHSQKLILLLNIFNNNGLLSLREIIKLNLEDFNKIDHTQVQRGTLLAYGPFTKALLYLKIQFSYQWLIDKIEGIKSTVHFQSYNLELDSKILLASIGVDHNGQLISTFNNSAYTFQHVFHYDFDTICLVENIKCHIAPSMVEKQMDLSFHTTDFYSLLIENLKRLSVDKPN